MNKDVIYIDVEDDITAIIGKIKASNEKIVALVPPKHVGVLQSAVNLRLLERMAKNAGKRMVLITNNQALIGLSAVAGIPVAKNLQTKPEIAEIPALSVDDGEDIIDGAKLPVGELEKTADVADDGNAEVDKAISSMNIDEKTVSVAALGASVSRKLNNAKSGVKVPNFNSFRKKLFIGIAVAILLIGGIVWATVFAPAATVIITARTTTVPVSTTATLGGNAATDVSKGLIQSTFQTVKKDVSVTFTPTGTKDLGAQASGTVTLSIKCSDVGTSPTVIPAGTGVSSGGKTFITQSSISVTTAAISNGVCFTGTGPVLAQSNGADYNLAAGAAYTVNGYPSVSGVGSAMTGGVTKIATIVTADDVQKASATLTAPSSDQMKAQLVKLFTNGQIVIDDSFTVTSTDPVSAPAVGAEVPAGGTATLTLSTTYTITAIAKSDVELYLTANINKQLVGKDSQRIYDDGIGQVVLSGYAKTGDTATVNITTTGQVGPKIDEAAIKQQVKGKIYGDVQAQLQQINGVSNVDVQFSYFWVRTVPNDVNKITVEFKLQNG